VNRRWVTACAAAEAIGMAAAAGAARASESTSPVTGLGLVVAGGLVEGSALGLLQANALHDLIGRRRTWVLTTVLVAGLGWTAGSAPAALSGADTDGTPPLGLVLLGAAGLGLVMGALLGAAQATVLRRRVRHAWRWVTANACGWAVAMPVVFTGATTAGSDWSSRWSSATAPSPEHWPVPASGW
jgi:MFS family permease